MTSPTRPNVPPGPTIHAASARDQPRTPKMTMPHRYLQQQPPTKDHTLTPKPRLFANPLPPPQPKSHLKNPVNATPPPHKPTRPQNIQRPPTKDPTYNPQTQPAPPTQDGKHLEPPCNNQTQINSTYFSAKLGTHPQPNRSSTTQPTDPNQPIPTIPHPAPNQP
jgi:hypothetical protein